MSAIHVRICLDDIPTPPPPQEELPKPKSCLGYLADHFHRPLRFDGCIPPMYHEEQRAMRELRNLWEERNLRPLATSADNLSRRHEISSSPEEHCQSSPDEPLADYQHLPLQIPSSPYEQASPIEAIITRHAAWHKKNISPPSALHAIH